MTDHGLADSGDRTEMSPGGATRDRAPGKGRFDLLSPFWLEAMAKHAEAGANKYAARNYEKGMPLDVSLDSAFRHLTQFAQGDDTEDHLLGVAFNAMMLWHTRYMIQRGLLPTELAEGYLPLHVENPVTRPCPTCQVNPRETVGMVCQTCGRDYGLLSYHLGEPESLESQVERLAAYIVTNIGGEPSQSQGAIDTAIRILQMHYGRVEVDPHEVYNSPEYVPTEEDLKTL